MKKILHSLPQRNVLLASGISCSLLFASCASVNEPADAHVGADGSSAGGRLSSVAAVPPLPSILTATEREFFRSFGIAATINGQPVFREADLSQWPAILARAEPSTRPALETIARAFTNREALEKFEAQMQQSYGRIQASAAAMAFQFIFSGDDSFQSTIATVNDFLRRSDISRLWRAHREFLEKGLEARRSADRAQDQLFSGVTQRLGPATVPTDMTAKLVGANGQIAVRLEAGNANIDEAVVQITFHRKTAPGQWTAANLLVGLGLSMIGINVLDAPTQLEGVRLSAAQEAAASLPWAATVLVEKLTPKGHAVISLGIPAQWAPQIDHVEVRVITAAGNYQEAQVPGLAAAAIAAGPGGPERALVAYNLGKRVAGLIQPLAGLGQRFSMLGNELGTLQVLATRVDQATNPKLQDKALGALKSHIGLMNQHLAQSRGFEFYQVSQVLAQLSASLPK